MFDLKEAVADWKKDLREESPCSREDITELESHLHDLMSDLRLSGLSEEEAFSMARHRVGEMPQLKQEYTKVNHPRLVRNAFARMALGWIFWAGVWAVIIGRAGSYFFEPKALATVLCGSFAILLVNFSPTDMWAILRDTFGLKTASPGRHQQATLFWRNATHALLATGAITFFVGIILLLTSAMDMSQSGPYLAYSILGTLYSLTLVCAVTIPGQALATKNGLDADPARFAT